MSYRDFKISQLEKDFGLVVDPTQGLFEGVAPVPLSSTLLGYYADFGSLGATMPSEKARSEILVAPLLAEVWRRSHRRIGLHSGVEFNVDAAAGLVGTCDFLLTRSPQLVFVAAPVLCVFEAKRDSIPEGLGQCGAAMVAAQRFNVAATAPIDPIYGCVTTGTLWRFLRLSGKALAIDINELGIAQSDRILGALLHCCGTTVTD